MRILRQATHSLIDGLRVFRVAGRQHAADQDLCGDGTGGRREVPGRELESTPEYGDRFISRMIQLSQMPRTRSPRDRTTLSMRPVPARPAYGL